jgi:diguanylate cyclase (GGDEF)-like protein
MRPNNNNPANQAKSDIRLIYGAAVAICLIFIIVGIYAWHRVEVRAEADLIASLAEETQMTVDSIDRQMMGVFNTLKGIANSLAAIDSEGPITPSQRLLKINLGEYHLYLGYAGPNGIADLYDARGVTYNDVDFADEVFFQQALAGIPAVENTTSDPDSNLEIIRYAYPVVRDSQVQGVLIAVYQAEMFGSIIEQPFFNDYGFVNLTDATGQLTVRSGSSLVQQTASRIEELGQMDETTLLQIREQMAAGKAGFYQFVGADGRQMLAIYQPVASGSGTWFVHSAVAAEYAGVIAGSGKIASLTIPVLAMLVYLSLFFVFAHIVRRGQILLNIQTERSLILEETANEHLIEYTPATDTLRYSFRIGNGQLVKGEFPDGLKEKKYHGIVAPEYWDAIEAAADKVCSAPDKAVVEYLSLPWSGGKDYEWHRLTLSSLGDEKGRVISVLGRAESIQQLMKARENASLDPMTGILNKASLRKLITEAIKRNGSANTATLMIDLDNFKQVNDSFGHAVGDIVLQRLAQLMQRVFAVDDLIGRFGGDEFVVFMQHISRENAEKKVRQFEDIIAQEHDSYPNMATPSIGVFYTDDNGLDVDTLISRADQTMYEIKHQGKNGHGFWQPT